LNPFTQLLDIEGLPYMVKKVANKCNPMLHIGLVRVKRPYWLLLCSSFGASHADEIIVDKKIIKFG
jgi:hypothetical protein